MGPIPRYSLFGEFFLRDLLLELLKSLNRVNLNKLSYCHISVFLYLLVIVNKE